jgi:glycosyltransferase involved in cell wall biosynthesis
MMSRVLFVVSANVANAPSDGPRKDYRVLTEQLGATVLDYESVNQSRFGRLLARFASMPVAQAWQAFRRRNDFDAILTDGEHIGIPLALLLKLARAQMPHVTIGHRVTAGKKRFFFRWLKVHSHISKIALHARAQFEQAQTDLGIPASRLELMPYQVDTDFWHPLAEPEERLLSSAGLEFRDYPTLMAAVDGVDAQLVIGAASHWSKRRNTAQGVRQPDNVTVSSFDYPALRQLYARSAVVVVPLDEIDFQAGVTTILEAMAMAKPVIVTHTLGQTDVVQDRRRLTRGEPPRRRPHSLLGELAEAAGQPLEQTGFYVPPLDPVALRRAIVFLLDHPEERARLGQAGRRVVEQFTTVDQYAQRLNQLLLQAQAQPRGVDATPRPAFATATGD